MQNDFFKRKDNLHLEAISWYLGLNNKEQQNVSSLVSSLVYFSQKEYRPYFENCALFACGSSLSGKHYNDLDLVLVGFDFRAIYKYDKVYLQDPKTLVDRRIVSKDITREKVKEFPDFEIEYNKVNFGGEAYFYDADSHIKKVIENCNLDEYCKQFIYHSELVKSLYTQISTETKLKNSFSFSLKDVINTYFLSNPFLITGVNLDSTNSNSHKGIDFIISAENLTIDSWIKNQENLELPFKLIHSWANSRMWGEINRNYLTQERLPDFIDGGGKTRFFDICEYEENPYALVKKVSPNK